MSEQLHNNLSSFTQGKLNISAKIVIFLRDKECSDVSSEAKIDINKFPLKFTVRIADSKKKEKLSFRTAKWQKNNNQSSDISASDCTFEGNLVNLNFKHTGIRFQHFSQKLHTKISLWTFVMDSLHFAYKIKSAENHTYYRLTESANVIEGDLNGLEIRDGHPVFCRYSTELVLNGEKFLLFYEMQGKSKRVFVETEGNINNICSLLSFYVGAMIEWDMKISDYDKTRTIDVREPYYKTPLAKTDNEPLKYMVTGKDCLDHLYVFQDGMVANGTNMDEDLSQNIELYTRAILLDNRSRFLTYYSIIEKMGTENDGVEISKYLKKKNIDFDKLSCGIASEGIKDHSGQTISNIRCLRNEIVHHIGSSQIDKFMRETEIISRMQYTACIIILWQMGFKEIRFVKEFNHLSVFNDKVEPYDYFKENNLR